MSRDMTSDMSRENHIGHVIGQVLCHVRTIYDK